MNAHDFTSGAQRIRSLTVLDDKAIAARAPSVFTTEAMPTVSAKYQFVQTSDVLADLRNTGYEVVEAHQSKSMTDDGHPYVKHQLRLIHGDYISGKVSVGDTLPELSVVNAHNRSSSFILRAALKRLACNNGLMVAAGDLGMFRVMHTDKAIHDHIVEAIKLVEGVHREFALPTIEAMKTKMLTAAEQRDFALGATLLKWNEFRENHIEPLLVARRPEDEGDDLWTVLNRVQENAVRGGYAAVDRAGRNVKASGIKAVDRDIDFNSRLWTLGNEVLHLA
jgi:hypothetical protein